MANEFMEHCSNLSTKAINSAVAFGEVGARIFKQTTEANMEAFNGLVKQMQNYQNISKTTDLPSAHLQMMNDCNQNCLKHVEELTKIASNGLSEASKVFQLNMKDLNEKIAAASKVVINTVANPNNNQKSSSNSVNK